MGKTSIEWTDESINPLRARLRGLDGDLQPIVSIGHYCEKVSPGCKNCYSSAFQPRFGMPTFQEQRNRDVEHWLDVSKLEEVLRRRKPTKFFWCDMTDMFGDWVPFESIAACFGVMAATPQHTHQVLTKRPERAAEWFQWIARRLVSLGGPTVNAARGVKWFAWNHLDAIKVYDADRPWVWPLPNVWLGVSTENQATAEERIPQLLKLPAAVRFISAEPLLGPLDLSLWLRGTTTHHLCASVSGALKRRQFDHLNGPDGKELSRAEAQAELRRLHDAGVKVIPAAECDDFSDQTGCRGHRNPALDWVIVGGESGNGARPFNLSWARAIVRQCRDAGVACFVKQVGSKPEDDVEGEAKVDGQRITRATVLPSGVVRHNLMLANRKGGDWSEWPESLRVRQFPEART